TKEDQTMDVLRYIGLPDTQKARVQAYFTYVTQFNHPGNLVPPPCCCPGFLYRKHLEKIPLFSNLEPAFLVSVAQRMRI
ncbi:cyclic nucleotide-binding domain-containing protein, partial [Haematococcus lacustris]